MAEGLKNSTAVEIVVIKPLNLQDKYSQMVMCFSPSANENPKCSKTWCKLMSCGNVISYTLQSDTFYLTAIGYLCHAIIVKFCRVQD